MAQRTDAMQSTALSRSSGWPSSNAGSASGLATHSNSAMAQAKGVPPCARLRALSQTPRAPMASRAGMALAA